MLAIAKETLKYPEYSYPNWVEGKKYIAADDGSTLVISNEQCGNMYFMGKARTFMLSQFDFIKQ